MATDLETLRIRLEADIADLKTGLAQAQSSIKGVDDSIKTADGGIKQFAGSLKTMAGTLGVAFAGTQLVSFAKDAVMAASNMAESVSKVNVVFGAGAEEVYKFGESAATNLGISNQAALEAAGTYGNLFQAFGLGQGEAQEMSTSLVQLAADMASFNNTSIDDAILALRSGLSGETEPLKKFGVALSDVRLKTEAMSMGLIKSTSEALTPAAKAQASYALIMKDTALAQGDYARTADGTANTMKSLKAKIDDAKVALGEALMPAFRAVLKILELLVPILQKLGDFIKDNGKAIAIYSGIVLTLVGAWKAYRAALLLGKAAQDLFMISMTLLRGGTLASIASTNGLAASVLRLNAAMRANPIGLVVTALVLIGAAFVAAYKKSETFRNIVNKAIEGVMKVVAKLLEGFGKFMSLLGKVPGMGWAKGIADGAQKAADKLTNMANAMNYVERGAASAKGHLAELENSFGGGKETGETTTTTTTGGLTKEEKKRLEDLDKLRKKVKDTYGDMRDVIKEASEKAATALETRNERMLQADENYKQRVSELTDRYNEQIAASEERFAEQVAEAHENYGADMYEANSRYKEKVAEIQERYNEQMARAEEKYAEQVAQANKRYNQETLEANKRYNEKVAELNKRAQDNEIKAKEKYADSVIKITKDYTDKAADLEKKYLDKVSDLRAKAEAKSIEVAEKGQAKLYDIIEKGRERLRSAWSSGTAFSIKDLFGEDVDTQGAGNFIDNLRSQLDLTKVLQEKAGELAGKGYTQTFIEQIVKAGPDAGTEMANALLELDEATQAEIQDLYMSLETLNTDGMNSLAESMSTSTSFATGELADMYAATQEEIKTTLAAIDSELKNNIALAKTEFDTALADAASARDEKLAEALKTLQESIADTKAELSAGLAEATEKLTEALTAAKTKLDETLAEASKDLLDAQTKAKAELDKSLAEASKELQEAQTKAKAALDKALEEAQKALTKSREDALKDLRKGLADADAELKKALLDAQKDYEKAIDEINKSTDEKLEKLKKKLAEVAAAMKDLGKENAPVNVLGKAPVYTPIVKSPASENGGQNLTTVGGDTIVTINGVNLTDPQATASSIVSLIKYGETVQVANANPTRTSTADPSLVQEVI